MIRKISGGIAVLVIVVLMILNVNISAKNDNMSDISLANQEALADGENGGDNPWWLWPTQGLTKDETPRWVDCSISYGSPVWLTTVYGKKRVCDDGGSVNCTTSDCII